jgi:hypothetical protein
VRGSHKFEQFCIFGFMSLTGGRFAPKGSLEIFASGCG